MLNKSFIKKLFGFRVLLVFLMLYNSYFSFSQKTKGNILFETISNEQGLTQSTVYSIVQDTLGYMWFVTEDGLNRYDGSRFYIYKNNIEDEKSLLSSQLRKVFLDKSGALWVGGSKGVSRYNAEQDNFDNFLLTDYQNVRLISDIEEDISGNIWTATFDGRLFKYDKKEEEFKAVRLQANDSIKISIIRDIYNYEGDLLLATDMGLYIFDVENHNLRKVEIPEFNCSIRVLLKRKGGGENCGLAILDKDLKFQKKLIRSSANINSLCNNNIRSLDYDDEGKLWIGTFRGLSVLGSDEKTFENYFQDNMRPYALGQNCVRSLYNDEDGGMWLGTFYGGVSYYHPNNIKFNILSQNGGSLSLSDNVVSVIKEDKKGNVWIGTNGNGLNLWNRKEGKITHFTYNPKIQGSLNSDNIKSLLVLDNGKLLVGTYGSGLNYFDPIMQKNKMYRVGELKGGLDDNSVYAILKDSSSQIWLGTNDGLYKFNFDGEIFKRFNSDRRANKLTSENICVLFEDSKKRIWIGTQDGLNIYHPKQNIVESFKNKPNDMHSLSQNFITSIYEDSKNRLWIGTNSGLNLFSEDTGKFVQYNRKDGLKNDFVNGILEDGQGRLWISTNSGIFTLNANNSFKRYELSKDVQNIQFNKHSYCMLSDSTFAFGGTKGLTYFNPNNFNKELFRLRVSIESIYINNKKKVLNDTISGLDGHINKTKSLILQHDENTLALRLSVINYSNNNIQHCWILENFDKDWRCHQSTKATYTNLPPGKYVFKIRVFDPDFSENVVERELKVIVLKPWWFSNWAWLGYFLFFALILFFSINFFKERIKTLNDLRTTKIEKLRLTQINQMKIQFFTSISHEFRTPLTLILSPLEKILEKQISDAWMKDQLSLVNRNAKRLLVLINQLLEFRKLETNKAILFLSKGEFVSTINDIYLSFASSASQKSIVYTFQSTQKKLEMCFDSDVIEKIFYNLISNALKFTSVGGTIGLNIRVLDKRVLVEVNDSGKGIAKNELDLIFDRYYTIKTNATDSSGIGLALAKRLVKLHSGKIEVESVLGVGSKFTVSLPINLKCISNKEGIRLGDKKKDENKNFDFSEEIIEKLENETVEITGVPVSVVESSVSIVLEQLINDVENEVPDSNFSQTDLLAKSLAKSLAIKTGQRLTVLEQEHLVNSLFACKEPTISPTNRATTITMRVEELDKRFN